MFFKSAFLFFLGLASLSTLHAQNSKLVSLGGLKFLTIGNTLPETLTNTRSAVIISTSSSYHRERRPAWKPFVEEVHKSFRKIGIDAIVYIHANDLNAGPEVTQAYLTILSERKVNNLIYIHHAPEGNAISMTITRFFHENFIEPGQLAWAERHEDWDRLALRLGRQVLRQELVRSNFLIPEGPEYLDDLVIYDGTRLENFPSRMKSLPIAVVPFSPASQENIQEPEVIRQIQLYNDSIQALNRELVEILKLYPYEYELVKETDMKSLYDAGFQYVLFPIGTSAKTVKNILDYQTNSTETAYISVTYNSEGKRELKQFPVNALVWKYYIRQTIVRDLHTGEVWDADATWQAALTNFIFNIKATFK